MTWIFSAVLLAASMFGNLRTTGHALPGLHRVRQNVALRQSERGIHVAPARAERLGLQPKAKTPAQSPTKSK